MLKNEVYDHRIEQLYQSLLIGEHNVARVSGC